MVYLCSQRTPNAQINYFMLDWSIYTLFVLNRGCKRDSLQITIFVHVCSKWSIVELKTCYETSITTNNLNGVSLIHHSYILTIMAYLATQRSPKDQIMYFMFDWSNWRLFLLNTYWKRILSIDYIRKFLLNTKHGSTKKSVLRLQ
jgi:hypothetical protein